MINHRIVKLNSEKSEYNKTIITKNNKYIYFNFIIENNPTLYYICSI